MDRFLPYSIGRLLRGMDCRADKIGCSSAFVYRYFSGDTVLYLKGDRKSDGFTREQRALAWLQGRLPVPEILALETDGEYDYLLMTAVPGRMACADESPRGGPGGLVSLLSEGIRLVGAVDTADCPFDSSLSARLSEAEQNIADGLVDFSQWEENNRFSSPSALLAYLKANRPPEEPAFCHGDFCLPNIFVDGDRVAGFIDLGRAGVGDVWQDIALCVRSLLHNYQCPDDVPRFFAALGMEPDYEKVRYYILLDELF